MPRNKLLITLHRLFFLKIQNFSEFFLKSSFMYRMVTIQIKQDDGTPLGYNFDPAIGITCNKHE